VEELLQRLHEREPLTGTATCTSRLIGQNRTIAVTPKRFA
jgi:hypothetical protein